jgi:crossover junction endodeoxyribonuclease RuvC
MALASAVILSAAKDPARLPQPKPSNPFRHNPKPAPSHKNPVILSEAEGPAFALAIACSSSTQQTVAIRTPPIRYTSPMRVFGIDCGTEFTGYGVVEVDHASHLPRLIHRTAGTIRLNKKEKTPQRLAQVYAELTALMALHEPEVVAIEEVFFSANAKSALKLGQVRGVAMLAAATSGLPVVEYAPLSIKSAVVGYGLAAKEQVQFMVTRLLELSEAPDSPDAADALAIAICHIHTAQTLQLQGR